MNNAEIETKMYEMAVAFLQKRFPTGWGGVGIVHTAQGSFFTSVALECANASALLCIETGAMCEAQKYNERVTHCLCVVREDENAPFTVAGVIFQRYPQPIPFFQQCSQRQVLYIAQVPPCDANALRAVDDARHAHGDPFDIVVILADDRT